jgi:hypothetical protein
VGELGGVDKTEKMVVFLSGAEQSRALCCIGLLRRGALGIKVVEESAAVHLGGMA